MEAKEFGCLFADAVEDWALGIVDSMAHGNPKLLMPSVYIKNGIRNYRKQKEAEIKEMVDNTLLFVADEKGDVNIEKLMGDVMSIVKNMEPVPFDWGLVSGELGDGKLKFHIPDNWLMRMLFGDKGAIVIGEEDFQQLVKMMV